MARHYGTPPARSKPLSGPQPGSELMSPSVPAIKPMPRKRFLAAIREIFYDEDNNEERRTEGIEHVAS
jgi:hypothetical protein